TYDPEWKGQESSDKSYPGDNRLITPKRSQRRRGLAPRCRLVASWGGSTSQGLGCSPIKAVRELGSERCETVRDCAVVSPTAFDAQPVSAWRARQRCRGQIWLNAGNCENPRLLRSAVKMGGVR